MREDHLASDPSASAWVSANAGAGKTYLLTMRAARLLLAGARPERILCLTYTKAAAAEMTARLSALLSQWTLMDDAALSAKLAEISGAVSDGTLLLRARRLFAEALETPGGLKIQTIHAFCERILRRFPLEAQIPASFSVLDDRSALQIMSQASDETIAAAAELGLGHDLALLAQTYSDEDFKKAVRKILEDRQPGQPNLGQEDIARLIANGDAAFGVVPGTDETALRRRLYDLPADRAALLRLAVRALAEGSKEDRKRGDAIAAYLEAPDNAAACEAYRLVFLTKDNELRERLITQAALKSDRGRGAQEILRAEQDRVKACVDAIEALRLARLGASLLRFAAAVRERYEALKRRATALDFDDLVRQVARLFSHAEAAAWILYKLDGGIDHILVDEAQDTSPQQWEVVRALADEFYAGEAARERLRTLFVVGDEKQSIFSFQGADPGAFIAARAGFATRATASGATFHTVSLSTSRRSLPLLLEAVDTVFAGPAAHGVTTIEGAIRHAAHRHGQHALIEIWPLIEGEKADEGEGWDTPFDRLDSNKPVARLADDIAAMIAGWLSSGERLASRGGPITAGDILILVRKRGPLVDELVRRLKARNVPVAGADRLALNSHIAILDLLALGRFTLFPEDDLTLAALLKSPLCNITEDALFHLAHGRQGSLWSALRAASADARFAGAHRFLSRALAQADFATPFQFYARILSSEGGRTAMLAQLGAEARDPIDEFLTLALSFEREHAPSMQAFLAWFEAGAGIIKRDLENAGNAVRIMTVHGAKGLEAGIVIMPDTTSVPSNRNDPPLLAFPDHGESGNTRKPLQDRASLQRTGTHFAEKRSGATQTGAFVVRAGNHPLIEEAKTLSKARAMAEYHRLLYVAMTRARDRLYVCGAKPGKGYAEEDCWYGQIKTVLAPRMAEVSRFDGKMTVLRLEAPQEAAPDGAARAPIVPPSPSLPVFAQERVRPELARRPASPSEIFAQPHGRRLASSGNAGDAALQRGRLIHRLFQTLPELDPAMRRAHAARFLGLARHALSPEAREEILSAVFAVLDDPEFSFLFGPGSMAEVRVEGDIGHNRPLPISGQIDRLCVRNHSVTIIDFKTDRSVPATAGDVSRAYLGQMAVYGAVLRQVYPQHALHCSLLFVQGPRILTLPPPLLAAMLTELDGGTGV
ncbi:MAG: double-strand break repair helicase AddA [Alphaproteobacteria bacterium]|nr:double-strand break repair helicase AddA [Alphaproteobacteria bacterium]